MPKPSKQKKQFKEIVDRAALELRIRCDLYEMDNDEFSKLIIYMYKLKSVQELDNDQFEITTSKPISEIF